LSNTATKPEIDVSSKPTAQRSGPPVARLLLLAGLLVLAFWLATKAWRIYGATQSLLSTQEDVNALMAGGLNGMDPDEAQRIILQTRQDVVVLRNELAIIRPVAPYLGGIPRIGPLLAVSPHLLDMADGGTEAAVYLIRGLKPGLEALQDRGSGGLAIGPLLGTLASAQPDVEAAARAIERVVVARAQISNVDALPWRVRTLLEEADRLLPLAQDGLRLLPALPEMMGFHGPRRYLIIAQNEDELRPTGGFITGAGLLEVANGEIVSLAFEDANVVDNYAEKPYDFPPQPLYEFMGLELFLLRDANFWPDFPTSAQKALDLYSYGQDSGPLDGAIAIDQQFLSLLVNATGPLPVSGTNTMIRPGNVIELMRDARGIQEGQTVGDWVENRKLFMQAFSAAIQDKIQNDFGSLNPIALARTLYQAIEERHLQLYMTNAELAAALAAVGWDGRLPQAIAGDFLMVVDTNMGYNKANVYIQRDIRYQVSLQEPAPQAELAVHYTNSAPEKEEPCYQGTEREYELSLPYLASAEKCYWNYLRVYTPAGSQLVESSRHIVPGETLFSGNTWESAAVPVDEAGTGGTPGLATFANFLLVANGRAETSTFTYTLPSGAVQREGNSGRYQLIVQKQAGTGPEPLALAVTLPTGGALLSATPEPTRIEGETLYFEQEFIANMEFVIDYLYP
jgi:hypothetical protein